MFLVFCILFNKCLYFSYYMSGYLLHRPQICFSILDRFEPQHVTCYLLGLRQLSISLSLSFLVLLSFVSVIPVHPWPKILLENFVNLSKLTGLCKYPHHFHCTSIALHLFICYFPYSGIINEYHPSARTVPSKAAAPNHM